jgi:hypothetical protein
VLSERPVTSALVQNVPRAPVAQRTAHARTARHARAALSRSRAPVPVLEPPKHACAASRPPRPLVCMSVCMSVCPQTATADSHHPQPALCGRRARPTQMSRNTERFEVDGWLIFFRSFLCLTRAADGGVDRPRGSVRLPYVYDTCCRKCWPAIRRLASTITLLNKPSLCMCLYPAPRHVPARVRFETAAVMQRSLPHHACVRAPFRGPVQSRRRIRTLCAPGHSRSSSGTGTRRAPAPA